MKKIMKKVLPMLLALAMVLAVAPVTTKAADYDALYVLGTTDGWTTQFADAMTKSGSTFTYDFTIAAGSSVQFKISTTTSWDNVVYDDNGNNFSQVAGAAGAGRITVDTAAGTVTVSGAAFDVRPTYDALWVHGTLDGWTSQIDEAMTKNGDIFTYTTTVTTGARVEFKITTAAASWDAAFSSNGGNFAATAVSDGTVVITVDQTRDGAEAVTISGTAFTEGNGGAGNGGAGNGDVGGGDVSVMPIVLLALAAAATVVVVSKKRVHA